jgi:hypothetical protein
MSTVSTAAAKAPLPCHPVSAFTPNTYVRHDRGVSGSHRTRRNSNPADGPEESPHYLIIYYCELPPESDAKSFFPGRHVRQLRIIWQ